MQWVRCDWCKGRFFWPHDRGRVPQYCSPRCGRDYRAHLNMDALDVIFARSTQRVERQLCNAEIRVARRLHGLGPNRYATTYSYESRGYTYGGVDQRCRPREE